MPYTHIKYGGFHSLGQRVQPLLERVLILHLLPFPDQQVFFIVKDIIKPDRNDSQPAAGFLV
jgi:hypothetical protein